MQAVHIVQKNPINIKLPLISALALLSISFSAAAADCYALYPPKSSTSIINVATSYAGNDLPIGSVIYNNQVKSSDPQGYGCNGPYDFPRLLAVTTMPYGPSSIMLASGRPTPVFPTNVSGVGVTFYYLSTSYFISEKNPYNIGNAWSNSNSTIIAPSSNFEFSMSLIKTGPIASGSVVQASSFPTIISTIPATPGHTGLPLLLRTVNWQGSIVFTTSTCSIPDVNVNMGSKIIHRNFSGIGSTTDWVDSSIILQNCPTFSGRFSGYPAVQTTQITPSTPTTGTATGTNRTATLMTVSLTPNTTIFWGATNGVFAVNAAGSTGQAATGVGIQLGYSVDINASPTLPTTTWTSGTTWNITLPNDGRSSFKIPLAARYYQISNTITPGPANASVTFNIQYK